MLIIVILSSKLNYHTKNSFRPLNIIAESLKLKDKINKNELYGTVVNKRVIGS